MNRFLEVVMKNVVKILMVMAALLVLGAGQVWAYPISSGETVYLNERSTGGPYGTYGGGDFGVSTTSNGDVLFNTFCLELGVFMDFNTPYTVSSIADYVEVKSSPNRNISDGTKYLFWHFNQETLGGFSSVNFNPSNQDDVRALQLAIWTLEGYGIGSGTNQISQDLITGVQSTYDSLLALVAGVEIDESQMNVKVMNLMSGNTYVQSQLIAGASPVPEPGTLLLLGSGLAGLALYRRRVSK
ncbi:MAG: PEP-CTERM sorting domain-containing protein [Pelovirga sp.]